MLDQVTYDKVKDNIKESVVSNYRELLGFLQSFYSINVAREIMSGDSDIDDLTKDYLDELYSSDAFKKYLEPNVANLEVDDKRAITTVALMDSIFPEFLNGSFNPNEVNSEGRAITCLFLENSNAFNNRSQDLKNHFTNEINKPIDRSNYTEVPIVLIKDKALNDIEI